MIICRKTALFREADYSLYFMKRVTNNKFVMNDTLSFGKIVIILPAFTGWLSACRSDGRHFARLRPNILF
jgi:hypothetical protein